MKHDYLWDGSGEPDPEIQKLERLLTPLGYNRPAPDFSEAVPERRSRARFPWFLAVWRPAVMAPAFAGMVLVILAAWWGWQSRAAYDVVVLNGTPRVGWAHPDKTGRLSEGQWLETDKSSRARINIGDIGQVEVEPNTRIGLMRARSAEHRLSLQRGVMHALIWAPPGQFFVNTPSAVAIDLGCAYTLEVDENGAGFLRVTSGWVAFDRAGRESFVPAGAVCAMRPGIGPGTPCRGDTSPSFSAALARIDFPSEDRGALSEALQTVLSQAGKKDAFTLWHLLFRVGEEERVTVFERLAALVPPPDGVTRAGILSLNRPMLDLWWNALGLGDTGWWRIWERPWPASK